MKPTLCSRCKKNVAVVFITRLDPNGQNSHNEGLCLKCARELNIRPVTDMIEKMGLSDEELEGLTNEMMSAFDGTESMQDLIGNITESLRDVAGERDEDEDEEEGRTATFPFLNRLFSGEAAKGGESGGHVGEMTTMALVPQVVDAVHVPVIAAGGIADGRGLAAALALGACGVQVGTCLLASTECPIHENYKAALLKARDSDTIVTGRIGGTPVRVLKNRMSREYVRQEKAGADKMALERFTLGSLRKAVFDGDTENGSLMAGQAAGLLHEVRPVEEIFAAMVSEAKDCIAGVYKEITL